MPAGIGDQACSLRKTASATEDAYLRLTARVLMMVK